LDDAERWQHALFFALSPQERCHLSLKTARSALSVGGGAKILKNGWSENP